MSVATPATTTATLNPPATAGGTPGSSNQSSADLMRWLSQADQTLPNWGAPTSNSQNGVPVFGEVAVATPGFSSGTAIGGQSAAPSFGNLPAPATGSTPGAALGSVPLAGQSTPNGGVKAGPAKPASGANAPAAPKDTTDPTKWLSSTAQTLPTITATAQAAPSCAPKINHQVARPAPYRYTGGWHGCRSAC